MCCLREISLQNRKFTWTNERRNPTLAKLDQFFCNAEWDVAFNTHVLLSLSTSLLDHCLILVSNQGGPWRPRSFQFVNFWTQLPGFKDIVSTTWNKMLGHYEPFHRPFHKQGKTTKVLRQWSNSIISNVRLQLLMVNVVILRLDVPQKHYQLSEEELHLRMKLKRWILGLAVVERARQNQMSRITNLNLGDANTKHFHRRVTARRRKNHIQHIKKEQG